MRTIVAILLYLALLSYACAADPISIGVWQVDEWVDYYISVEATSDGFQDVMKEDTRFLISTDSDDGRAQLVLYHEVLEESLFIRWNEFVDPDPGKKASHGVTLFVQVDKSEVVLQEWELSNVLNATFYQGHLKLFVKDLEEADVLSVSVSPFGRPRVTHRFPLRGLSDALVGLRKHKEIEDPEVGGGMFDY